MSQGQIGKAANMILQDIPERACGKRDTTYGKNVFLVENFY